MSWRPTRSTLFPYTTLFRSLSGAAGKVLGGWQAGSIITLSDGTPLSVLTGFSRSGDLARSISDRPDLVRSEEHTSELQSPYDLVCRLLLEKKKAYRPFPSGL